MTTASARGIMVCIYVSMYHLPRVCHTLVPVYALKYSVHSGIIDMLMCVIYNCMHSTEQQGRSELLMSAMKILTKTGR